MGLFKKTEKPKKTWLVLYYVSAYDLGTATPWIAADDQAVFEAEAVMVSRQSGNLYLYDGEGHDSDVVAVFPAGRWITVYEAERVVDE